VISVAGGPWQPLPVPANASGAFPTDINDVEVIVGVADMTGGRRAIRWIPSEAGYAVEVLPLLPGELASYATGINNLGQVVGARAGILGTPYGFGWLYTDAGGLVDLNASYGWFATPEDINDAGVILSGTQTFDLATQALTDVSLNGPSNYNAIGGIDINNYGEIVGSASLRSVSLNIVSVFRYLPGTGWAFISGSSKYTVANDINNNGDLCWGEQGAGIYFEGQGAYALGSLLDPEAAAAGWVITGNGCMVNDHRVVATLARNNVTGQSGAVLLTPAGLLPPPAAPTGLTATPHPATSYEPYMSINLSWNNGDALLTKTYELERRVFGQTAWTSVELVPPAMSTFHQDTTVAPATTYDYRVRAVGVAGPGPWSATASATAPPTPLDITPPVVTIVTPGDGATVSGIVSISAQAIDNVGVELLEISFWNQYLGQEVILGSIANSGNLTVNWDTRSLTPATYAVWAFAHDSTGNWTQVEVSVNVTAPAKSMKVTNISLSGKVQGGKASITGNVYVRDALGQPVVGTTVHTRWTLPNGSTTISTAQTDSSGRARFTISGARGTYTLTVTNVVKAGYLFDAAGSVLSRSITK
jgi:probable HAF family extracellular repeat protein